jgi:GntR family transcriptional regulator/MocR family aminotransferase
VTRHHSVIDQAVLCDFIELGHFGRHLRRTRKIYAERLSALSYFAQKHLTDFVELSEIEAGLQTVGWLRPGLSAEAVTLEAARRNIDVVPLSRYLHRLTVREGLQIGFAAVDEAAIELGTKRLADAARAVVSKKTA